jgi:60 kDa SS-A/Ro ribonucleoprotein
MSRATQAFSTPVPTAKNSDNYPAYERATEEQYLQTLLTNTVGNTFYADKNELLQEANQMHDAMIQKDAEYAAKALGFARQEGFMRLQPIFGLVKLFELAPGIAKKAFSKVVFIPSDLQDFMTVLSGQGHGEGGRAVKREVSAFLNCVSEYWALKYNGQGRGYSLGDMVSTAHPKATSEKQNAIFQYLIGKEYNADLVPQISAFEQLKKATTSEDKIRLITEGRIPHEVATGAVKPDKAIWNAILPQMPIFALLRNLNTMDRAGVLDENRQYITEKLTNAEALKKSKILPFRFLNAFNKVESGWAKDVLRHCVELTFGNLPEIPGRTAVFLDISGSMDGEYLRIGSVFALALFKKTKGNGVFWLFDTNTYDPKASLHDSILSQAERIHTVGGTDTGAPVRALIGNKEKVDNIIIITDEQQNTGSPFYRNLVAYREKINRDTRAFVIDIAPYRSAMIPPSDKNSWYIYGWSDTVLQYISMACQGFGGMVEKVKNLPL